MLIRWVMDSLYKGGGLESISCVPYMVPGVGMVTTSYFVMWIVSAA